MTHRRTNTIARRLLLGGTALLGLALFAGPADAGVNGKVYLTTLHADGLFGCDDARMTFFADGTFEIRGCSNPISVDGLYTELDFLLFSFWSFKETVRKNAIVGSGVSLAGGFRLHGSGDWYSGKTKFDLTLSGAEIPTPVLPASTGGAMLPDLRRSPARL